jgi:hypothetical protein
MYFNFYEVPSINNCFKNESNIESVLEKSLKTEIGKLFGCPFKAFWLLSLDLMIILLYFLLYISKVLFS